MNRLARFALLFGVMALTLAAWPAAAFACTAPPGGLPKLTTADRTRNAPIVLEGVVTGLNNQGWPMVATLQVAQYIKGSGPAVILVSGYGSSSVCLSMVAMGDHLLFYVGGDETNGYRAYYSSQFDAVAPADDQTLAEAMAASGQQPIVPDPNTGLALTSAAQTQLASATAPTPTTTPWFAIYLDNPRLFEMTVNDARDTAEAAQAAYATDPARQSFLLTQANGTLQAGATISAYLSLQASQTLPPTAFTPTSTPTPNIISPGPALTQAWATMDAAITAYPNDPAGQSVIMTQAYATIEAAYSNYALTATPVPHPPGYYYPPGSNTPISTPAPTAGEVVGLVGVGVVIGLILGGLGGIVIGLLIGRWRE